MPDLSVGSSPHIRDNTSVRRINLTFIAALLPVLLMACLSYGWRALLVSVLSVAVSALSETLFCLARRKPVTTSDFSCVVTGLLLAFCLPVQTPYLLVACGALFAEIFVKMLFGGVGSYFAHPALYGVVFLYTWSSFPSETVSPYSLSPVKISYDALFGTTGTLDTTESVLDALTAGHAVKPGALDLFVGNVGSTLGTGCLMLLLVCGLFLLVRGVITWHVPVAYFVGVAVTALLIPFEGQMFSLTHVWMQLCAGATVLCAVFVATDTTSSPVTDKGRLIFGLGCGVLTVVLRAIHAPGDGALFAVLFMDLFVGLIDKLTRPRRYGRGGERT